MTLARHPSTYVTKRGDCPHCGAPLTVDGYRKSGREARRDRCNGNGCGYPFPHRRGSLYCEHYTGPAWRRHFGALAGLFGDWSDLGEPVPVDDNRVPF